MLVAKNRFQLNTGAPTHAQINNRQWKLKDYLSDGAILTRSGGPSVRRLLTPESLGSFFQNNWEQWPKDSVDVT